MSSNTSSQFNLFRFFLLIVFFTTLSDIALYAQESSLQNDTLSSIQLQDVEISVSRPFAQLPAYCVYTDFDYSQIKNLPNPTIADILKYVPGVDIRERGQSGVQSDISIRGATGNQIKILINGIDFTDPQTQHYSSNLPIDPLLIDKIEVVPSSNFASDAFAGTINIITKQLHSDSNKNVRILGELTAGQHGLVHPSIAVRYNNHALDKPRFFNTSASYKRSEGYRHNTDYHIANFFLQTGTHDIDFQMGGQMKNVGANAFYSTTYPYQFDATRAVFSSLAFDKLLNSRWRLLAHISYRLHFDKFELFRDGKQPDGQPAPEWYTPNKHQTHTSNAFLLCQWQNNVFKIIGGLDIRNEFILSSNLGKHNRTNIRYFTEATLKRNLFHFAVGANGIYNSRFGNNYTLALNVQFHPNDNFQIYLNGNRTVRIPTFTDLYYSAPNLRADKNMKPEKAWTIDLSGQWTKNIFYAKLSAFYRWGGDIIDWVKPAHSDSTVWFATNHTSVNALGGELVFGVQHYRWINNIELNYSLCNVNTDARDLLSNYALDFLKHKFTLLFDHKIYKGFGASWNASLRKRNGEYESLTGIEHFRWVFLLDICLYWQNNWLKISVNANNATSQLYYDFSGIPQPKHQISTTVRFTL